MFFNFFYLALRHYERGVLYIFIFFVISSDLLLSGLKSTFYILAQNLTLSKSMFNCAAAAAKSILLTTLYSMVSSAKSLMLVRIYFTMSFIKNKNNIGPRISFLHRNVAFLHIECKVLP